MPGIEWNPEIAVGVMVIGGGLLWFSYRYIRHGFDDETDSNPEQGDSSSDYKADWARLTWWGKLGYLFGAAVAGLLCGSFVFGFLFVIASVPINILVQGFDWDAWYVSPVMSVLWVVSVVGTAAWFLYAMREFWQSKSPTPDVSDRP